MRYNFECDSCQIVRSVDAEPFKPPTNVLCFECERPMDRVYGCQINTYGCRDHDHIPPEHRIPVSQLGISEAQADSIERRYHEDIERKRSIAGPENRQKYSVPAPLYWGKIRETKDRKYWSDEANLKRHRSCEIRRTK